MVLSSPQHGLVRSRLILTIKKLKKLRGQDQFLPPSKCHRQVISWTAAVCAGVILILGLAVTPLSADDWAWQNPNMSPNPTNNIHNDSYLTDSYAYPGPENPQRYAVDQADFVFFRDPDSGEFVVTILAECAAQAFDADGDIQTVCAGLPDPNTGEVIRRVVTIDKDTLRVKAHYPISQTFTSVTDFGGAGYFYQDDAYRMVVASGDGHIRVLERQPSPVSRVDRYVAVRDIDVTGADGAIPLPDDVVSLDLYAVVPDKDGNIWFTTQQAVVGIVTLDDQVEYLDLNDPDSDGQRDPQPDGQMQEIANSHAVDEGETPWSPSAMYVVTTYRQYKLTLDIEGRPAVAWQIAYDHGPRQKSGQVSWGSGSSPTVFNMGGRRFVTITDNARIMHVNVYRAETILEPGEKRLFAQVAPLKRRRRVSNEQSLVVMPGDDTDSVRIFGENNWGNNSILGLFGPRVTRPGFYGVKVEAGGDIYVESVNRKIRAPSVVPKGSIFSELVYTYHKKIDGWYLTALEARDVSQVRFSFKIGPSLPRYNNWYAALALDADGNTVWVGTVWGLTRVTTW